jgi:MFS superfamily sulfate permease-like transporter
VSRVQREAGRWPARAARRRARGERHELVRLVTRLVIAQTGLAAAIGLPYSRRHLPSIVITLMLAAALWGLAMVVRSGTHAAWTVAIGFETAYILFGLFRFFTSRYLGGTLFAIITLATLLHPAVARAFADQQGRGRADARGTALPDVAEGALEGGTGS